MTNLITNPWVIGIGAGIISSSIVFFITHYFLERRKERQMRELKKRTYPKVDAYKSNINQ
jgi:hypothetical protein